MQKIYSQEDPVQAGSTLHSICAIDRVGKGKARATKPSTLWIVVHPLPCRTTNPNRQMLPEKVSGFERSPLVLGWGQGCLGSVSSSVEGARVGLEPRKVGKGKHIPQPDSDRVFKWQCVAGCCRSLYGLLNRGNHAQATVRGRSTKCSTALRGGLACG